MNAGPAGWERIDDTLWVRLDKKYAAAMIRDRWAIFKSDAGKQKEIPKYDTLQEAAGVTDKADPPEVTAE